MLGIILQTIFVLVTLISVTSVGIIFAPKITAVSDHLEFAGTLIGAAGTIFAGWLAWAAVQYQRQCTITDLETSQLEAKKIVATALVPMIHATAVVNRNLAYALNAPPALRKDADENIDATITLLTALESGFPQYEIARELSSVDRERFQMIYAMIKMVITSNKVPPPGRSRDTVIKMQMTAIEKLQGHVSLFDTNLADAFKTDT